jgi:hypothetical protein
MDTHSIIMVDPALQVVSRVAYDAAQRHRPYDD